MNKIIPLIARVFIGVMYLKTGVSQLQDLEGTAKALESKGIAMAPFFAASSAGMLIIGALLLLLGFKPKVGAVMLLIFLVPTTFLFHWKLDDPMQVGNLIRNFSLVGGLLMVIAYGGGDLSVDNLLSKKQ